MSKVYKPCGLGIHVCGADEEANEFFTIANYPARSQEDANEAFERAKAFAAINDEPTDCVIDLMAGGDILDDFRATRQMLPRIAKAIAGLPA